MFELINKDTGEIVDLTDGDIETFKNALTNVAADCEHIAARVRHTDATSAEAFHQSAQSYRKLYDKLGFII